MSVFHENKQKTNLLFQKWLGMSVVFMSGIEMSSDTGNF